MKLDLSNCRKANPWSFLSLTIFSQIHHPIYYPILMAPSLECIQNLATSQPCSSASFISCQDNCSNLLMTLSLTLSQSSPWLYPFASLPICVSFFNTDKKVLLSNSTFSFEKCPFSTVAAAISLLGIYLKKHMNLIRYMHPSVHSCIICNCQYMEAT